LNVTTRLLAGKMSGAYKRAVSFHRKASFMQPFASVLSSLTPAQDGFEGTITPDWLQGRTLFGGMGAALCLHTARKLTGEERPLRSMTISYIAPVSPDAPFEITPRVLREGRNVTQASAELRQNGAIATAANFCFAKDFPSALSGDEMPMPAPRPPEESDPLPFFEGMSPSFARHFDMHWSHGAFPVQGAEKGDNLVWVRHKDNVSDVKESAFIAMADALPPSAISMLSKPAPLSTLTWQLNILDPSFETEDQWWLTHARVLHAANGYVTQESRFWNSEGKIAAAGWQSVAVFG
jgi:acyl-CoA thioesterase